MRTRTPRQPVAFTPPTKVTWRIRAALSKNPKKYAKQLERILNKLALDGYTLVATTERNGATLVHGQRVETVPLPLATPLAALLTQPQLPKNVRHEVVYTFLLNGKFEQLNFGTLEEAVHTLRGHLEMKSISPLSITTVVLSTFEPSSFEALLSLHKETSA